MRSSIVWAIGLAALVACSDDDDPSDPGPGPEPGTISGTVMDLDGEGVGDATVSVDGPQDESTTTSANGTYTFDDLEPGNYDVSVEAPAGYVIALGASETETTQLAEAATANVDFRVAPEADADVFVVTLQGVTFSPDDVTISAGERIRWISVSGTHTVTPDGHEEWEDQPMPEGEIFEHRFESAGDFEYYCAPHLSQDMTGIIRVEN